MPLFITYYYYISALVVSRRKMSNLQKCFGAGRLSAEVASNNWEEKQLNRRPSCQPELPGNSKLKQYHSQYCSTGQYLKWEFRIPIIAWKSQGNSVRMKNGRGVVQERECIWEYYMRIRWNRNDNVAKFPRRIAVSVTTREIRVR